MSGLSRPFPPAEVLLAEPAPEVAEWLREAFILPGGPLENPHHSHLEAARIAVVWAGGIWERKGLRVLGTAELPGQGSQGGRWKRDRSERQLLDWFGALPDFLITFEADAARDLDEWSWCALCDHELYHCAQALDDYGSPRFNRETGLPVWAMRGHDVEEFVGVVERWGTGTANPALQRLVEASGKQPAVRHADVRGACGVCRIQLVS